ncbi:MAG TPA: signal recognition particle-docking protein FtsY [Solirubrobacteraceae bacterium]|nr:signal recognition particle-docking protein FtsY [Solirubrobacteraceae bacterium]
MAREWSELLRLRGEAPAPLPDGEAASEARGGFFRRLRESLRATREALGGELGASFARTLEAHDWEALEEALITADVGASATAAVVEELERVAREEHLAGEALRERLATLLAETARGGEAASDPAIDLRPLPTVLLIVGVNGTGKTTTLGKLAWQLREHFGLRVLLGAADTYRAAATEQLEGWARRAGCEIVTGAPRADPGSVAFEALARARAGGFDVLLIDTAGRLHNQEPLMGELEKVRRVIGRQLEGAPHETLLTIDATTGQNGLRQAELFARAAAVDGIVLTKLDGSAKGGVAIAIARELGIPVKLIGVGEQLEDLRPFDPDDFARALVGLD